MAFSDELHGIARAFDVGNPIVRTLDGGRTWSKVGIPNAVKFDALVPISGRTAWVLAQVDLYLSIYRTLDGGQSWEEFHVSLPPDWSGLSQVAFADQDHGYVALGRRRDSEVRLLRTRDGGRSWMPVVTPPVQSGNWIPSDMILALASEKVSFVFSTKGDGAPTWDPKQREVLFTRDGGDRWERYPLPFAVHSCQAMGGGLVCSADQKGTNFGILRLNPK